MEASPIQNTNIRVQKIKSELESLHMEFQDVKKGNEVHLGLRPKVWCTMCNVVVRYKDQCPVDWDYIAAGGPNPLKPEPRVRSRGIASIGCSICQVSGMHIVRVL